ncbi:hypothetical protein [Thysanoplusia orichalcea nucleopolyhedrovirus]|uniref:F-box domain-containing protein n=1 Tax=Thysanoplusia orichalcea nucleopolyhedrovirus TaxID=101850 RepID=L0CJU4_9ABAC|nr:hypothetical protein [Thysanoplusia orichalcea nucleopolyhedrovirus]AGA16167.1 hypothetical protein [Thysanoplusia orichalcea nucleopolyhedrovirus]
MKRYCSNVIKSNASKRRNVAFDCLPQEIYDKIVGYLSLSDYCNLVQVLKKSSSQHSVIFTNLNYQQQLESVYKKTEMKITSYNYNVDCVCGELMEDEFYRQSSWKVATICGHQLATVFEVGNKEIKEKYHLNAIAMVQYADDCNECRPLEEAPSMRCSICKQTKQCPRSLLINALCEYVKKQNYVKNIFYLYEINA